MDYAEARDAFFQPRSDTAPAPGIGDWSSPGRSLRDAIEPIATICFWSEPVYEAYAAKGLDFLAGYVWGRASALGEPEAPVVSSAFGVFEPGLIESLYDAGRTTCSLADVRSAKESGAVAALRHVLGHLDADTEVGPVLAVLRRAADAASPTGRPFHSGWTALPWPADPLGQLWHACSILREHRGDGHVAAYVAAGLSGLESNLLTEARVGWEPLSYTGSRGWPAESMERASAGLASRGLLAAGGLTPEGRALRDEIEQTTDRLVEPAIRAAGPELDDAVARLNEWSRLITEAGWFPPDPYKRVSG